MRRTKRNVRGSRRPAIRDSENEREKKAKKRDETLGRPRESSRVLCVPCGWVCADACRTRRQECAKKRPASDKN